LATIADPVITTLIAPGQAFFVKVKTTGGITLTAETNNFSYIQIYTTIPPREIMIKGTLNLVAIAVLYDVNGRLVLSHKLKEISSTHRIDV